jgi:hypothetical protein
MNIQVTSEGLRPFPYLMTTETMPRTSADHEREQLARKPITEETACAIVRTIVGMVRR